LQQVPWELIRLQSYQEQQGNPYNRDEYNPEVKNKNILCHMIGTTTAVTLDWRQGRSVERPSWRRSTGSKATTTTTTTTTAAKASAGDVAKAAAILVEC
jgi:hypothetical protein